MIMSANTIYTSSGVIRNPEKPRTGVMSQNSVGEWFFDELYSSGIDISLEEFSEDLVKQGKTEDEIQNEMDGYYCEETQWLFGDWKKVNGKYEIDHEGECGF